MFLIFRLRTNINIRIKGFKMSKETKKEEKIAIEEISNIAEEVKKDL